MKNPFRRKKKAQRLPAAPNFAFQSFGFKQQSQSLQNLGHQMGNSQCTCAMCRVLNSTRNLSILGSPWTYTSVKDDPFSLDFGKAYTDLKPLDYSKAQDANSALVAKNPSVYNPVQRIRAYLDINGIYTGKVNDELVAYLGTVFPFLEVESKVNSLQQWATISNPFSIEGCVSPPSSELVLQYDQIAGNFDKSGYNSTGMNGFSEAEFAVGSVTGYRKLVWNHTGKYLTGQLSHRFEDHDLLRDGYLKAECRQRTIIAFANNSYELGHFYEQIPADNCGCGWWSYWDFEPAVVHDIYAPSADLDSDSYFEVVAAVEGAGNVILGEKGFRSNLMRVKALYPVVLNQSDLPAVIESPYDIITDKDEFREKYPADENYSGVEQRYPHYSKFDADILNPYLSLLYELETFMGAIGSISDGYYYNSVLIQEARTVERLLKERESRA